MAAASTGAGQLVTDGWSAAHDYADTAFLGAQDALLTLSEVSATILTPTIDTNLSVITAPTFAAAPVAPIINNTNPVNYIETPYDAQYIITLATVLDGWVKGASTGLAPDVEAAIWNRGRDRELVSAGRKAKESFRTFALRGFTKPIGALSVELQDAVQESVNTLATQSRDVSVKQAELEQTNRKFVIEAAWKIQEGLIGYIDHFNNRAVEAMKSINQQMVEFGKMQAAVYASQAQAYSAVTSAQIGLYKGQTDVAVAEANMRIESAKAQLTASVQKATVLVEIAKSAAQVSAQLAASALSAVNLSGSISDSSSNSASTASSTSVGTSTVLSNSFSVSTTNSNSTMNSSVVSNNINQNLNN